MTFAVWPFKHKTCLQELYNSFITKNGNLRSLKQEIHGEKKKPFAKFGKLITLLGTLDGKLHTNDI